MTNLAHQLSSHPPDVASVSTGVSAPGAASSAIGAPPRPLFGSAQSQKVASITFEAVKKFAYLPRSADLLKPEVQHQLVREVQAQFVTAQAALDGLVEPVQTAEAPDVEDIVRQVSSLVATETIDVPKIVVLPTGDETVGYTPFKLDLSNVRLNPVSRELLIQHLRTQQQETISFNGAEVNERRLEDYIVRSLMDFDDVDYDAHAELLYDLGGQVVAHLGSYLTSEEDVRNVLIYHQKQLARLVHAQMAEHRWEHATAYEVNVKAGFSELKNSAATVEMDAAILDFRAPVDDKGRIAQMLFGGFQRCLFPVQKFQSDSERRLAVILDRDGQKWFRPARDQFAIFYHFEGDQRQYQPDFVVESEHAIDMIECKVRKDLETDEVSAKKAAALAWCHRASEHAGQHGGKPWRYLLVPHDVIADNMSLDGLATNYQQR